MVCAEHSFGCRSLLSIAFSPSLQASATKTFSRCEEHLLSASNRNKTFSSWDFIGWKSFLAEAGKHLTNYSTAKTATTARSDWWKYDCRQTILNTFNFASRANRFPRQNMRANNAFNKLSGSQNTSSAHDSVQSDTYVVHRSFVRIFFFSVNGRVPCSLIYRAIFCVHSRVYFMNLRTWDERRIKRGGLIMCWIEYLTWTLNEIRNASQKLVSLSHRMIRTASSNEWDKITLVGWVHWYKNRFDDCEHSFGHQITGTLNWMSISLDLWFFVWVEFFRWSNNFESAPINWFFAMKNYSDENE